MFKKINKIANPLARLRKKKDIWITSIKIEEGIGPQVYQKYNKCILKTTLHTYIWKLRWNGPIPQNLQTTSSHKIGNR